MGTGRVGDDPDDDDDQRLVPPAVLGGPPAAGGVDAPNTPPTNTPPHLAGPQHAPQPLSPPSPATPAQRVAGPEAGAATQRPHTPETSAGQQHVPSGESPAESRPDPQQFGGGHEAGPAQRHPRIREAARRGGRMAPRRLGLLIGGGVAAATAAVVAVVVATDDKPATREVAPAVSDTSPAPVSTATESTLQAGTVAGTDQATTVSAVATIRAGCGRDSAGVITDQTCAAQSLAGFWDGDWGQIVIEIDNDGNARAAYVHDDGYIVGTVRDGVLRGTWCETPYASGTDFGLVEMRIVATGDVPSIDGRWVYGTDTSGGWFEDWDVAGKSAAESPPDLIARLAQAASVCAAAPGS